jgi:hypothetical protein
VALRWALVLCFGFAGCQACTRVDEVTSGNFPCDRDAGAGETVAFGRQCPSGFRCGFDQRCYNPETASDQTRCSENQDCGANFTCGVAVEAESPRRCRSTQSGGPWPCLSNTDCFEGYRCDPLRQRCFISGDIIGPGQSLTVTPLPRLALRDPVLIATTLDDQSFQNSALTFDGGNGVLLTMAANGLQVVPFLAPTGASALVALRHGAVVGYADGGIFFVDAGIVKQSPFSGLVVPCPEGDFGTARPARALTAGSAGDLKWLTDEGEVSAGTFVGTAESIACVGRHANIEGPLVITNSGVVVTQRQVPGQPPNIVLRGCSQFGRLFTASTNNELAAVVECVTLAREPRLVFFRPGQAVTSQPLAGCPDGGSPSQVSLPNLSVTGRAEAFVQCGGDRLRLEAEGGSGTAAYFSAQEASDRWRGATAAMPFGQTRVHAAAGGQIFTVVTDGGFRSLFPSETVRAVVVSPRGETAADSEQQFTKSSQGFFISSVGLPERPLGDVSAAVPEADAGRVASLVLTRRGVFRAVETSGRIDLRAVARLPETEPDLRAPARALVFDSKLAKWILVIQRDLLFVANVLTVLDDPGASRFVLLEPRIAPVPGAALLSVVTVRKYRDGGVVPGAEAYANTAAQVVRLDSTTFDRWTSRTIELPADAIEPIKVWVEPRQPGDDEPRVGLRDGRVFSLPVAASLSQPITGGRVSDFAQVCTSTVAVSPAGLFRLGATPSDGGLATWAVLDAGLSQPLTGARFVAAGAAVYLSTTGGQLARIESASCP